MDISKMKFRILEQYTFSGHFLGNSTNIKSLISYFIRTILFGYGKCVVGNINIQ